VVQWLAIINVARGNHETEQFSFLVADKVQFESEEPSHRALASLGDAFECLMNMNTLILTYPKRCAVYKADACAFAKKYLFDEQSQWDGGH
jgi:hypothetical protein